MKLFIKYMVSNRCKMVVKEALKDLGLHFVMVDLGEVEIMEKITGQQRNILKDTLSKAALELMDDRRSILIEKIKTTIVEMVHHSDEMIKTSFSIYLSENSTMIIPTWLTYFRKFKECLLNNLLSSTK